MRWIAISVVGMIAMSSVARAGVKAGGDTIIATDSGLSTTVGNNAPGTLTIDTGSSLVNYYSYLGRNAGADGTALVKGTGSQWNAAYEFYIGYAANGTLTVQDGGHVESITRGIYLGSQAGTSGTMRVTGAGSTCTSKLSLYVATSGTGSLTIDSGGQMISGGAIVGLNAGGTGTVMVTGVGSTWTSTGSISVGRGGNGALTVKDGASITTTTLMSSMGNLYGNGTITASSGAVLDTDLVFDASHGLTQTLPFGTGGTLNLTTTSAGSLGAGYKGTGSLRIADGLALASGYGYLGYNTGASGAATVAGTGSTWTVGNDLFVGRDGTGTLTVLDGGSVTAKTIYAGAASLQGNGTIAANGAVMDADLVFDSTHPATQAISFGTGGTLNLAVTGGGALGAGYKGTGSLRVADGIVVTSQTGYLGYAAGSMGTATVSGTGSKWTNTGMLYVGFNGAGAITIETGGQITSGDSMVGNSAGSSGTVLVTGAGSQWASSGALYVGNQANGTLTIVNGGQVSNTSGYLGYLPGSSGTAIVSDSGSKWTNSSSLSINSGTLTVQSGGTVTSAGATLDSSSALLGVATVTDMGSAWTSSAVMKIGAYHYGTLIIDAGGQVSNTAAYLASDSKDSVGAVTVRGANSKWTCSSVLYVGGSGQGTMRIEGGAQVSSAGASLGAVAGGSGTVTITGPGSTWNNAGDLYINNPGTGKLTVADGGVVTTKTLYATGNDLAGNGTINVSSGGIVDADLAFDSAHGTTATTTYGAGGTLNVTVDGTSTLGSGYRSTGSLRVGEGVSLTSATAYLGYNAGSAASATVSGAGAKWTSSGDFYVGKKGSGTLTIEGAGQVRNTSGYIGYDTTATGSVTVSGTESSWTNSSMLNITRGSLTIQSGGQLSNAGTGSWIGSAGTVTVNGTGSTWTNALDLYVAGTLRAEAAGQISNNAAYLGQSAGTTGTVTVTGAGTKWNSSWRVYIGSGGTGTVSVEAGGQMTSPYATIGELAGSNGRVTVTGNGSLWTNSYDVYVGLDGRGSLAVSDGGVVTTRTLFASTSDLSGNGTINATSGAVLDGDLLLDSTHGITQALPFGSGGTLNLTISPADSVGAGYKSKGTLRIADGKSLSATYLYLGYQTGSVGSAIITGNNSNCSAGIGLWVGRGGEGTLTVSEGGSVDTATLYAPLSALSGNGTITVTSGAVLDGDLVFDSTHGTTQALTFGSGGQLNLTFSSSGVLGAGYQGTGTLRIEEAQAISTSSGMIGYQPRSSGTGTVSGAGSKWTLTNLYVGRSGAGTLNVTGGGQVANVDGYVGDQAGSNGTVLITGSGSKWTSSDALFVGNNGTGTMTIDAGGQVSNAVSYLYIGYASGSSGTVNINGTGSWNISGGGTSAYIGRSGTGAMNLNSGGQFSATSASVYLAYNSGSSGTITVNGAGSKLTAPNWVYVGYSGTGSVTISDGGQIVNSGGTTSIGSLTAGIGSVTVRGAGSKWSQSEMRVGDSGTGFLAIESAGQVTDGTGYVGYSGKGTATVTGPGSTWSSSNLYVGYSSLTRGSLTIADGAKVSARSLTVGSQSVLRLQVSNDAMLVLGTSGSAGVLTDYGTIALYADPMLPAGVYTPITEYAGRTMLLSGRFTATGGIWNLGAKTFTVPPPTRLSAGEIGSADSGQRILITDIATGRRVGASFGGLGASASFSATPMADGELAGLYPLLGEGERVLAAWNFTTDLAGPEVLLSYDVGTGASGLELWHSDGVTWSQVNPASIIYKSDGVANFTVNSFSGYAITGVPEPGAIAFVGLAAVLMVRRRMKQ